MDIVPATKVRPQGGSLQDEFRLLQKDLKEAMKIFNVALKSTMTEPEQYSLLNDPVPIPPKYLDDAWDAIAGSEKAKMLTSLPVPEQAAYIRIQEILERMMVLNAKFSKIPKKGTTGAVVKKTQSYQTRLYFDPPLPEAVGEDQQRAKRAIERAFTNLDTAEVEFRKVAQSNFQDISKNLAFLLNTRRPPSAYPAADFEKLLLSITAAFATIAKTNISREIKTLFERLRDLQDAVLDLIEEYSRLENAFSDVPKAAKPSRNCYETYCPVQQHMAPYLGNDYNDDDEDEE
jgi:hypothetical protein